MTYSITYVSGAYIHHASDRLVTIASRGHWDRAANKSIVYRGLDGYFAASYSGLAYVGDLPTDHLIAQAFHGEPIPNPPPLAGWFDSADRNRRRHNIGAAFARLETRLAGDGALPAGIEVVANGFQTRRNAWRAFTWRLVRSTDGRMSVQRRFCPATHSMLVTNPAPIVDRRGGDAMVAALMPREADPVFASDLLASEVRRSAEIVRRNEGVDRIGTTCVTVSLAPPPYPDPRVRVRFVPPPEPGTDASEAYTPWVVEPGAVHVPIRLTGQIGLGTTFWRIDPSHDTPASGEARAQRRMPRPT